jgi:hypothetical protein
LLGTIAILLIASWLHTHDEEFSKQSVWSGGVAKWQHERWSNARKALRLFDRPLLTTSCFQDEEIKLSAEDRVRMIRLSQEPRSRISEMALIGERTCSAVGHEFAKRRRGLHGVEKFDPHQHGGARTHSFTLAHLFCSAKFMGLTKSRVLSLLWQTWLAANTLFIFALRSHHRSNRGSTVFCRQMVRTRRLNASWTVIFGCATFKMSEAARLCLLTDINVRVAGVGLKDLATGRILWQDSLQVPRHNLPDTGFPDSDCKDVDLHGTTVRATDQLRSSSTGVSNACIFSFEKIFWDRRYLATRNRLGSSRSGYRFQVPASLPLASFDAHFPMQMPSHNFVHWRQGEMVELLWPHSNRQIYSYAHARCGNLEIQWTRIEFYAVG